MVSSRPSIRTDCTNKLVTTFTAPTAHSAVLDTVGEGERDGKPAGQPHVTVSRLALKALTCLTWAPSALFGMRFF